MNKDTTYKADARTCLQCGRDILAERESHKEPGRKPGEEKVSKKEDTIRPRILIRCK